MQLQSLLIRFINKMLLSANKLADQPETANKSSNNKSFAFGSTPKDLNYFGDSANGQKYGGRGDSRQKQNASRETGTNVERLSPQQRERLSYSRSPEYSKFTPTDLDHIIIEHNAQVETLLQEISKLEGMLFESERLRKMQLQRQKEEHQTHTYLQLSNLKHSQYSQAQVFELQIRKMKEQLNDKAEESKKWQLQYNREKEYYEMEKNNFKQEVRNLIEKKNEEIMELKQGNNQIIRSIESERDNEITELRYACDRELNEVCKNLEKREMELQRLRDASDQQQKGKIKIIEDLQSQKQEIEQRYERRLTEQYEKYENLRSNLNKVILETSEAGDKNWTDMQLLFNSENAKLFALIRTKDSEVIEMRKQMESLTLSHKIEQQTLLQQNGHLKNRLIQQSEHSLQDIELLKVKIALLHENDLKQLKQLYELKLTNTLQGVGRLQESNSHLREMLHLSSAQKYEMKKKFDVAQSQASAKMLKIKMGMSIMENDFKEKMQNEKSLMLMTSRSFMKEAEVKSNNNKFLEEELRKLRQLMDLQVRENENSEKAVEEKIVTANNELERLSNKIVAFAKDKKELQGAIEEIRNAKDIQILKLKGEIKEIQNIDLTNYAQLKLVEELKEERNAKLQEILILKDRVAGLQSRIKEMNAEYERCVMENQINQQEAKTEYHAIAESHLTSFKKFYEEKMQRVEGEKEELRKIIASQCEQITELIRKYRELEESMKEAVRMMKRRTELEEKVMHLGMDTNLVRNMSQLLPHSL